MENLKQSNFKIKTRFLFKKQKICRCTRNRIERRGSNSLRKRVQDSAEEELQWGQLIRSTHKVPCTGNQYLTLESQVSVKPGISNRSQTKEKVSEL